MSKTKKETKNKSIFPGLFNKKKTLTEEEKKAEIEEIYKSGKIIVLACGLFFALFGMNVTCFIDPADTHTLITNSFLSLMFLLITMYTAIMLTILKSHCKTIDKINAGRGDPDVTP